MTEAEQKALALVNEVLAERRLPLYDEEDIAANTYVAAAICRAIEQHEAFKREVSDKVAIVAKLHPTAACYVQDLIIAKPDPLVEAIREMALTDATPEDADRLRAALAARGLTITETKE